MHCQPSLKKTKPEDDAYLSETGRVLLDYLKISKQVAKQ